MTTIFHLNCLKTCKALSHRLNSGVKSKRKISVADGTFYGFWFGIQYREECNNKLISVEYTQSVNGTKLYKIYSSSS